MSSRPNIKQLLFSIGRQQVRILLIPLVTEAGCGTLFRKLRGPDRTVTLTCRNRWWICSDLVSKTSSQSQ